MAGGVPSGRAIKAILLGGAAGVFVGPDALDMPLTFEATRAAGATLGSGVIMVFDETVDLVDTLRRIARFFRDESCGQCVPCRVGSVRQEELLARLAAGSHVRSREEELACCARSARRCATRRSAGWARRRRRRSSRRSGSRDWWRCDPDTSGLSMSRDPAPDPRTPHAGQAPAAQPLTEIVLFPPARASKPPVAPPVEPPPTVELTIDGGAGRRRRGHDDPGRVPGARHRHADAVLRREPDAGQRLPRLRRRGHRVARPRARPARARSSRGWRSRPTPSASGRRARSCSSSSARRSTCRSRARPRPTARSTTTWSATAPIRRATVRRRGRAAPGSATPTSRATITPPPGRCATAATVAQPTKVDNDLYVRDYSKCILCYKCVEACGEDAQNTFAIAVAGRGFDARISTEQAVPLPESACVYCGNCIGVCPTGALMAKTEYDMRAAGTWDPSAQTVTSTICPYCGVGCAVDLHVQDERILKVTSPLDSSVTAATCASRAGSASSSSTSGRRPRAVREPSASELDGCLRS